MLGNYSLILLDFNFTKRPEVDVAKTTTSGKSHDMRAVCKIALFTVNFSHLHCNVIRRGCEAISG